MAFIENANAGYVFLLRLSRPMLTILFVDESEFCSEYIAQPWVAEEAEVILIDESITHVFRVTHVPDFRFHINGAEVSQMLGIHTQEDVIAEKQSLFGNTRILQFPALSSKNTNF